MAHIYGIGKLDLELVVRALLGHRTAASADECSGKELLSLIAVEHRNDPQSQIILEHLKNALTPRSAPLAKGRHDDRMAARIAADFLELCGLEKVLPRREWLYFLIAFLRTATAMWLLAHLRVTVLVRDWLLATSSGEEIPRTEDMLHAMQDRHEGLMHPTSTATTEVIEHVESYMRARVELRIMVNAIQAENKKVFDSDGTQRRLTFDTPGAESIQLGHLLALGQNVDWHRITGGIALRSWLTRTAETFPAWRSPRGGGQGKNIDEFIRVLYRLDDDDSDSGLLIRRSGGTTEIVPGHRLLQLFTFLAGRRKTRQSHARDRGKLVLRDLEAQLFDYGIDFRSTSFGRPLLIRKLLEAGLLVGSPDAGESAEVLDPIGKHWESRP
jgi:hypothetical protein